MLDPPSPPETVYTPFYCEENIYLLCEAFIAQQEDASAIIVSNELKTVALWNQKLSESVVVWDYHVVLMVRSRDQQQWIYDFDTRLPFPCLMQDYLSHTFREDVRSSYQRFPLFFNLEQLCNRNYLQLVQNCPRADFCRTFRVGPLSYANGRKRFQFRFGSFSCPNIPLTSTLAFSHPRKECPRREQPDEKLRLYDFVGRNFWICERSACHDRDGGDLKRICTSWNRQRVWLGLETPSLGLVQAIRACGAIELRSCDE